MSFQYIFKKDADSINESADAFVLADKTNNVYKVSAGKYKQLLTDNVSTHYMKDKHNTESNINKEAKQICERLDISDRVQRIPPKQAFITIKDHKENFKTNTKPETLHSTLNLKPQFIHKTQNFKTNT